MSAMLRRLLVKIQRNDKSITALDLSWNNLGDAGTEQLAQALRFNHVIRSIDLTSNKISDAGAIALAEALRANESCTSLDLKGNLVGDNGARALAYALADNKALRSINLWWNKVGDVGGAALADALQGNSTLRELNLAWNNVSDETAAALGRALATNESVKSVTLWWNDISTAGMHVLGEQVQGNSSITELDVSWNDVEPESTAAVAHVLERNQAISVFLQQQSGKFKADAAVLEKVFTEAQRKHETARRKLSKSMSMMQLKADSRAKGDAAKLEAARQQRLDSFKHLTPVKSKNRSATSPPARDDDKDGGGGGGDKDKDGTATPKRGLSKRIWRRDSNASSNPVDEKTREKFPPPKQHPLVSPRKAFSLNIKKANAMRDAGGGSSGGGGGGGGGDGDRVHELERMLSEQGRHYDREKSKMLKVMDEQQHKFEARLVALKKQEGERIVQLERRFALEKKELAYQHAERVEALELANQRLKKQLHARKRQSISRKRQITPFDMVMRKLEVNATSTGKAKRLSGTMAMLPQTGGGGGSGTSSRNGSRMVSGATSPTGSTGKSSKFSRGKGGGGRHTRSNTMSGTHLSVSASARRSFEAPRENLSASSNALLAPPLGGRLKGRRSKSAVVSKEEVDSVRRQAAAAAALHDKAGHQMRSSTSVHELIAQMSGGETPPSSRSPRGSSPRAGSTARSPRSAIDSGATSDDELVIGPMLTATSSVSGASTRTPTPFGAASDIDSSDDEGFNPGRQSRAMAKVLLKSGDELHKVLEEERRRHFDEVSVLLPQVEQLKERLLAVEIERTQHIVAFLSTINSSAVAITNKFDEVIVDLDPTQQEAQLLELLEEIVVDVETLLGRAREWTARDVADDSEGRQDMLAEMEVAFDRTITECNAARKGAAERGFHEGSRLLLKQVIMFTQYTRIIEKMTQTRARVNAADMTQALLQQVEGDLVLMLEECNERIDETRQVAEQRYSKIRRIRSDINSFILESISL